MTLTVSEHTGNRQVFMQGQSHIFGGHMFTNFKCVIFYLKWSTLQTYM